MVRVKGDITIERPVEEVFDFVADESNEPAYNPRMIRADQITPGPIGAGTRFESVMTGPGGATEMTIEFTEFDRPHRIGSGSPAWTSGASCSSSPCHGAPG
jgi:uncharacterized protein YndB with AHSA1/START domain